MLASPADGGKMRAQRKGWRGEIGRTCSTFAFPLDDIVCGQTILADREATQREAVMTPAKPDFSDPASVVRAFIHQMHCWEALAGFLNDSAQARYRPDGDSTLHPEEVRLHALIHQIPPFIVEIYLTKRRRVYVPSGAYAIPQNTIPATRRLRG
jgi:hypothetical protein